jgi:hypothetical protein
MNFGNSVFAAAMLRESTFFDFNAIAPADSTRLQHAAQQAAPPAYRFL